MWAETNRWLLDYTAGFDGDRFVRLSSRTLFAGDTSSLEQLYRMLGRDMPAASRIDRVLGKNLNAQTTGDFEAPGDLAAALGSGLLDFVRSVATGLGIDEGSWLGG